jgi:hypothetical protein
LVRVGFALSARHLTLIRVQRFQAGLPSQSAALRALLDEYIAAVPGFADALDALNEAGP